MAFSISDLTAALKGGGARPSLFEVTLSSPFFVDGAASTLPFLCHSASLPASTVGEIKVMYFGREIKLAGEKKFGDWQITVLNDEDFAIRRSFERWLDAINGSESNVRGLGATVTDSSYKTQAQVKQYSKDGTMLREYQFVGMFPTAVAEIQLNWAQANTIEDFQVTLAYDYFVRTL